MMIGLRKYLIGALVMVAATVLSAASARADILTYTFSGDGTGDIINGSTTTAFNGDFTFTVTGNTASILPSGGEYFLYDVGGTFTEGSFSATLDPTASLVVNPSFPAGEGAALLFNSDFSNGVTVYAAALAGYNLATPIGPIAVSSPNDPPTVNAINDGFGATNGDVIEITGDSTLTFTVRGVPEPGTIGMLGMGLAGLIGLALFRKRSLLVTNA
jgi:hypothetical protein